MAAELARRHPGWRLLAIDLNEDALRRGRGWAAEDELDNVAFVRADLTRPFAVGAFDVVAAVECLCEIPDDEAALARMGEALRPGGLFLTHVPEARWRPVLKGMAWSWKDRIVRHGYSKEEIATKVERAGLRVTSIRESTRGTAQLAQDFRDRTHGWALRYSALAYPLTAAAVRFDEWGITWGAPRSYFVIARKP